MKIEKQTYSAPDVAIVKLDNEISLTLDSVPPIGPGEVYNIPSHFNANDPLKG